MEINRLRHFLTVARLGSVRAASSVLHISAGGLSKSLMVFENEIGKGPLFRREGRGIFLTDVGRDLEGRGNEFLSAYSKFIDGASPDTGSIQIKIATFEVFSTYFLGALCDEALPESSIVCFERLPGQIEEDVIQRRADFGLTYEPIPMQGLDYLKIAKVKMGVFGLPSVFGDMHHTEWPFAAPNVPLQHAPSGVKGLDGWPDDKVFRQVKFRVDMMESALELARRGLAVVHIPCFVASLCNQKLKQEFHLKELTSHPVRVSRWGYIVKRIGTTESKLMKKVARVMRDLLQKTDGTKNN